MVSYILQLFDLKAADYIADTIIIADAAQLLA